MNKLNIEELVKRKVEWIQKREYDKLNKKLSKEYIEQIRQEIILALDVQDLTLIGAGYGKES